MTKTQAMPVERPNADAIIGENVHRLMWRARLSQTQLSAMLGITQGALSRKLRGDRPWYADEIKAAAGTFTVPVGSLFVELPDLDSNQEPAVSAFAVGYMDDYRDRKVLAHHGVHDDHDAFITPMRLAVNS